MIYKQGMKSASARHLAVLGCGDLGLGLQALLPPEWQFTALRRNLSALPSGIAGRSVDYSKAGDLTVLEQLAPDYVITTLKPVTRDPEGYRRGFTEATKNLLAGLGGHRPRAIVMLSSTRVYAEQQGGWVNERSAVETKEPAAAAIVAAEQCLLDSGQRVFLLRCGGIYGATTRRSRLLERVASGELTAAEPLRYSNRIHREDVVGFLQYLLSQLDEGKDSATCFNCVDDEPAPQREVEQWLAGQLGIEPGSERAPGAGHKRCSNTALKASGYNLRHPSYRSGYRVLLAKFKAVDKR